MEIRALFLIIVCHSPSPPEHGNNTLESASISVPLLSQPSLPAVEPSPTVAGVANHKTPVLLQDMSLQTEVSRDAPIPHNVMFTVKHVFWPTIPSNSWRHKIRREHL